MSLRICLAVAEWATCSESFAMSGTLITDLVEPVKNELVWRATMVANLEDTAQDNIALVEQAIAKAYKNYPPKPAAK